MASPEVHHLFHRPIADHAFSSDKQLLAVAKENIVDLYHRTGNDFALNDELKGHDKTVTGVDIAPRSGKIVTCSQGMQHKSYSIKQALSHPANSCKSYEQKTGMPMSGSVPLPAGSLHSSSYGSTEPPRSCAGHHLSKSLRWDPEPVSSPSVTSKRRTTGGSRST